MYLVLLLSAMHTFVQAQDSLSGTRFFIGLSAPELLHAGIDVQAGQRNRFAGIIGVAPSWGTVWTSLTIQHRFFLQKNAHGKNGTRWFTRESFTFFPANNDRAITLTCGAEWRSRKAGRGWQMDAGAFLLLKKGQYLPGPALRFARYWNPRKKARPVS